MTCRIGHISDRVQVNFYINMAPVSSKAVNAYMFTALWLTVVWSTVKEIIQMLVQSKDGKLWKSNKKKKKTFGHKAQQNEINKIK